MTRSSADVLESDSITGKGLDVVVYALAKFDFTLQPPWTAVR